MIAFFKTLFQISDESDFPPALKELPKEWKSAESTLTEAIKFKGELIIILGEWGSGKSTFISTLLRIHPEISNRKITHRLSLSAATSIDEVFSMLILPRIKVLYISALLTIAFFVWHCDLLSGLNTASELGSIVIVVGTVLYAFDRFRFLYMISAGAQYLLSWIWADRSSLRKSIFIIEDLDRGSLESSDIYNTLYFRFRRGTSYIVPLGFNSSEKKIAYIDMAQKLEAKIILLGLSGPSLFAVFSSLYPNHPFTDGNWMPLFSVRRLIAIGDNIKYRCISFNENQVTREFIAVFLREIASSLGIEDPNKPKFNSDGRGLSVGTGFLNPRESDLNSFLQSISEQKWKNYLGKNSGETAGKIQMQLLLSYNSFETHYHT